MSKFCWKNGADSLAQGRVVTKLQLIKKNVVSGKYKETKHNKMRYACIYGYTKEIKQIYVLW